jgi:hypothetical protein
VNLDIVNYNVFFLFLSTPLFLPIITCNI